MAASMVAGVLSAPAAAASASAKSKPIVKVGTPKASPRNYEGECPKKVTFSSTVKLKLKGKAKVQYRWIYDDGSKSAVRSFTARGKGTTKSYTLRKTAKFTGDSEGWYALQVVAPRKVTSKRGYYSVTCEADDPDYGKDRVEVSLSADQGGYSGPCTPTQPKIGFTGTVRVYGGTEWVTYRWLKNGDVVDSGSARADEWTKLQYSFKPSASDRGWVSLEVDHPHYKRVVSDREYYSVKCEGSSNDVSASVSAPADYKGSCPATRTFTGSITHNGSGKVSYQWIGENYTGPIRELDFSGWGSSTKSVADEPVSTSSNVWRKLRIHSPKYVESNAATAKVECETPR
ncbi:hypothetical protein [Sinosporangium siamense]|uniref:Ig-like domain-containing protein n=1 Tax=Sinosporangium siamense TaxID=1367973 RepID=A0A919RG25_9ACTN|nr:hypothetical protein [Sinosporangium siamense]GII93246.1 hypothetical protein Ssi02_34770 [Sinosporangium siamense]